MSPELIAVAKTFTVKKLPASEVEFSGEIPATFLAPYAQRALAHFVERLELPGFRKGHVPEEIARKKVGELALLEEATELCVKELYPALVIEHKVDAVGRPDIRITKLAPENPVGITATTTVYPVVELAKDWKKVGEKIPPEASLPATDEEVQTTLEQLRKSRTTKNDKGEEVIPELDDEFAKTLGAFENLEALKVQIRKGITEEKERATKDKRRGKIIDALLEKTKVDVPKIFVESELDKIMAQMKEDVSRFGMTFEQYLERSGKTEQAMREEFRKQGEKRAKTQLALNEVIKEEKIEVEEPIVEQEIKLALEHFPEAKPDLVRIHIETVLRNDKALQLLEAEDKKE